MIDHENTDELVCPWCGTEITDSWEYSPDDADMGVIQCDICEKLFKAERITTIEYTTERHEGSGA